MAAVIPEGTLTGWYKQAMKTLSPLIESNRHCYRGDLALMPAARLLSCTNPSSNSCQFLLMIRVARIMPFNHVISQCGDCFVRSGVTTDDASKGPGAGWLSVRDKGLGKGSIPHARHSSKTRTRPSTCSKITMIYASLDHAVFISNFLSSHTGKTLFLNPINPRSDYQSGQPHHQSWHLLEIYPPYSGSVKAGS